MLRMPSRRSVVSCCLVLVVGLLFCRASQASERTLERQLLKLAPQILEKLRGRGYESAGVLKFRIQMAGRSATDSAGTLNTFLAHRLEVALVLANPNSPNTQMKIIRDASGVAAEQRGASHLSAAGRKRLFSASYPVAWGAEEVKVDALITGVAQFAPDNETFRLGILLVRPDSELELLLPPVEVETDESILHEAGLSFDFHLRGGAGTGDSPSPAQLARQVQQDPQQHFPLSERTSISLLIFYDGRPITPEYRDGEAWIPEPRVDQEVTMQLERMDSGDGVLGVVLKINGENTIYHERKRGVECAKWILKPESGRIIIPGFLTSNNQYSEKFRVASREESRALEMHYGPDVGTISVAVFEEATDDTLSELAEHGLDVSNDDAPDVLAIASGWRPDVAPQNSGALQSQVRQKHQDSTPRGVVVGGERIHTKVNEEHFDWAPNPVLSAVIHYYQPEN